MAFPGVQEARKVHSRDDLRALYEQHAGSDKRFELIDGEIYEVPTASFLHSVIAKIILKLLMLHVEPAGLGEVFPDGTGYDLPNGNSVIPDVSFIAADRVPPYHGELAIAPDLAVEVVSPSNTQDVLRKKINGYLESGTRRVWVVYPDAMEVDVHWLQADGSRANRTFGASDTLTGEDVIPGFSVKIAEIFPQLKPSAPKADA